MTPEAKTKLRVRKILDAAGVYYFMPSGTGVGRAGIPDIICCVNGFFLAIECKAGKGKTTALQDRELVNIRAARGAALVVYDNEGSLQDLYDLVQAILKRSWNWL